MKTEKSIIVFASVDGQTAKICRRIEQVLKDQKFNIVLHDINSGSIDLANFDKVILASSIRYGKHHPKILELIETEIELLNRKKSAFISVNLVARKAEKRTRETNPYVVKFLKEITWKPDLVGVFGGALDYKKYTFWDKTMIRLIMMITKGPVFTNEPIEYTDWNEVMLFGDKIREL